MILLRNIIVDRYSLFGLGVFSCDFYSLSKAFVYFIFTFDLDVGEGSDPAKHV